MIEALFPYILIVHISTVLVIISLIACADYYALRWTRGIIPILSYRKISLLHRLVWCGLIIMILSGTLLFYPYRDFLVTLLTFKIKMMFVLTLVINSFYIGHILSLACEKQFATLSPAQKLKLGISGFVSGACWIGAITAGTLLEL